MRRSVSVAMATGATDSGNHSTMARVTSAELLRLAGSRPGGLRSTGCGGYQADPAAAGAYQAAQRASVHTRRFELGDAWASNAPAESWALFSAGTFEQDVETVRRARAHPNPPSTICAVAAGVQEFASEIEHAEGIYGVGQWFPGNAV